MRVKMKTNEQSSSVANQSTRVADPFREISLARVLHEDGQRDWMQEFDVCVIGSGPGGAIAAQVAAEQGLRTILVEDGPFMRAHEFSQREADAMSLYQEHMARRTLDGGVTILQGRVVGGSSTVNWTSSFRTPTRTLKHWSSQFAVRGLEGPPLDSTFNEVEERLGVAPWQASNANNQTIADGCQALGWTWGYIPRNVRGCWNIGYCGLGCPTNAKLSALTAAVPEFLRAGGYLLPNVFAVNLEWSGEQVTGVRLRTKGSHSPTFLLRAKEFVVAGGAIGSPALLLRSKVPDPYDLIGKRTFLHPVVTSFGKFDRAIDPFAGAPQSIYSDHFLWPSDESGAPGFKIECMPLLPTFAAGLAVFSGDSYSSTLGDLAHVQGTMALQRDGFHEESPGGRVILDRQLQPILDYVPSAYQYRGFQSALLAAAELQFAAGARAVIPLHLEGTLAQTWKSAKTQIEQLPMRIHSLRLGSAHVMGGCAMSENPKLGVVNSLGRFHHFRNLMVCDGSVFPTSLGVNPQISIFAIALTFARAKFVH
jgi:choline dehydrogenase-like flavoprotein